MSLLFVGLGMHLPRIWSLGSNHAGQISRLTRSVLLNCFQSSFVSFIGGEQYGKIFSLSDKRVKNSFGHSATHTYTEYNLLIFDIALIRHIYQINIKEEILKITWGVLHPIASTAGFRHRDKSKYKRYFLSFMIPVPQTLPNVSTR